jgi:hypothetical protein
LIALSAGVVQIWIIAFQLRSDLRGLEVINFEMLLSAKVYLGSLAVGAHPPEIATEERSVFSRIRIPPWGFSPLEECH